MRVTILGSSPSCPNPGGASSGYLLESRGKRILVDCGHGVVPFVQTVSDFDAIDAIIISHMHPDHFFDLVPLKYGIQFTNISPRLLYLPPDGCEVLERLRVALELPTSFWTEAYDVRQYDPAESLDVAGVTIDFAHTHHFIPAYAMRFTAQGEDSSLGYTSDTAWSEPVIGLLRGTSLAIIEATLPADSTGSVTNGHLTPAGAGEMLREAGVPRGVLTHYWHALEEELQAQASRAYGRPVEMAHQGRIYEV